jgi:hypothetical protein
MLSRTSAEWWCIKLSAIGVGLSTGCVWLSLRLSGGPCRYAIGRMRSERAFRSCRNPTLNVLPFLSTGP